MLKKANLQAKIASRPLYLTAIILLVWSFVSLILAYFDPRLFQGVSVWWKPWKFQISTSLFLYTLSYFLYFVPEVKKQAWAAKFVVWGSIAAAAFELIYIAVQASYGQASHFNVATPLYALLYNLMAFGAMVLTTAALVLGILVFKHAKQTLDRPMRHAISLGLIITFVLGSFTGSYLGAQRATGHWVGGVTSDAASTLIFHWSKTGGDLRVSHFFSLHAMQFLPLIALYIASTQLKAKNQIVVVWLFSASYALFCVGTFIQAVRGVPFLA